MKTNPRMLLLAMLVCGLTCSSSGDRDNKKDEDGGSPSSTKEVWLKGHTQPVTRISYSPDGKHIASSSADCTVKVWDTQTGRVTTTFKGHANVVDGVSFSPDGKRIASASADHTLKLWNVDPE